MSTFWFYAYTIGSRWGADHGVQCKSLLAARETAERFARDGDCMQARVSVSRSVGTGADYKIETLLVERHTPAGFVDVTAEAA